MEWIKWIEQWFVQYEYWVLLVGLPLDAIASPIPPGNTTLTFTGYLAYKGLLSVPFALLLAFVGAYTGIMITYVIGYRIGQPLVIRFGKWIGLKPQTLAKLRLLYNKYGNAFLIVSFLTPGFRQIIGYFAGMLRVPFRVFALYAAFGAALWVSLFFSLGYVFGEQWQVAFLFVEKYLKVLLIVLGVGVVLLLVWRWVYPRIAPKA